MADLALEQIPVFASPDYAIIHQGLMAAYEENEQQAIERLIAAWEADRNTCIAAWNAQREAEARAAEEEEQERRRQEEEQERVAREQAEAELGDADKKKLKMNMFAPGTLIPNVLMHPPSQYALQKLKTFDYVELWYFSPAGRSDAARHSNKSHTDDTLGISRVEDLLTVRSINSVRASRNALPDHELTFMEFIRARNNFLDYAEKTEWPKSNLNAVATFVWRLETHPTLELPLGEKIILTYASRA
ncbi:hypothetical protein JVT61DRAFT_7811 [Boletus reticuloceps]|uniref:Uncharacterized protein n=1 Tax=Boletus reticuloceps TaxID=495285 RepID=A0A8I2YHY1_9AGAM|nr:hypothetical protein JVT61DRAFT_7811 [Boletus reticuloceps]